MKTFGLIKEEGEWNTPSTDIYYGHYFKGYKPLQSYDIFGLINSTDGNFWFMEEDDDHYWTTAKISEETIHSLYNSLKNDDFSTKEKYSFSFEGDLLTIILLNMQNNKEVNIKFNKYWIESLIKTLDIDNPVLTTKEILKVWDKSIVPDKINYPLMTPYEYTYHNINMYPTLYSNKDFEFSKFKTLDQIFNTIGNGCPSIEDFEEALSKKSEIDIERAKRFSSEKWFDGYSKVEYMEVGDKKFKLPDSSDCVVRNIFEEEKEKYSDVIFWKEHDSERDLYDLILDRKGIIKDSKFKPYPNFQKEYSIVWNEPEVLNLLNDEWKKEIIWFYETSLFAINNGCFKDYSEFPTGSSKEDKKRIEELSKRIKDKTHEQVSKDYEVEFNGDMVDFMTKRWLKTKKEYISFIEETIDYINLKN